MDALYLAFGAIAVFLVGTTWFLNKASKRSPRVGPEGQQPYGFHGLLYFFVWASFTLAPLIGLGRLENSFSTAELINPELLELSRWGSFKSASQLIFLAYLLWQWIVCVQLATRFKPSSAIHARVVTAVAPVASAAAAGVMAYIYLDVLPNVNRPGFRGGPGV
ncbi:MAG TPA: hypothetical protein PKA20_12190 [Burkholderiaceae bacterium]|nr:hypothetical protein [Burkholderiaceae bacterium]